MWTEEIKERIKDAAKDQPLNLQRCQELANEELFLEAGVTARGIIAFARKNGLAYEPRAVGSSNSGAGEQPNRVRHGAARTAVSSSAGDSNLMAWIGAAAIVAYLIYALVFYQDDGGSTGGGGSCRAKLERCLESESESRWETRCQPEYYRCIN